MDGSQCVAYAELPTGNRDSLGDVWLDNYGSYFPVIPPRTGTRVHLVIRVCFGIRVSCGLVGGLTLRVMTVELESESSSLKLIVS